MNLVGRFCPVFVLATSMLVFGCNPPAAPGPPASEKTAADHDHDHAEGHDHEHLDSHEHEHHETYADAVKELDELRLVAKKALAEGNLNSADEAVHEIGHILDELPALADKEIAAADETVKPAIHDLFDCFDDIDRTVHGEAGKTYDELADRIDAAMKTLRDQVKAEEK